MRKSQKRMSVRILACYLIAALMIMGIAERSFAGFSPSEMIRLTPEERTADIAKVRQALETKMVTQKLAQLGFSHDEIQSRLGQLSDSQLHKLAMKADEIRVGGDGLGVVIAVLAIAILVVLFLYVFKRV